MKFVLSMCGRLDSIVANDISFVLPIYQKFFFSTSFGCSLCALKSHTVCVDNLISLCQAINWKQLVAITK